jgi:ssDNA thymidine ADP-ribosyltransferase DarT-like protein
MHFLDRLDWDCINNIHRIDPLEEYIRVRHAEVLVPDIVPLGLVKGIFVRTRDMVQAVDIIIEECGLKGRIPAALRRKSLYF